MANFGHGAGYGGHEGGDPPHHWAWIAPAQNIGAAGQTVRGAANSFQEAVDAVAANQGNLLWISFERHHVKTWQAVGAHSTVYMNLLGWAVRNIIPLYFDKWSTVPQQYKDEVRQVVRQYFYLDWYLARPELDQTRIEALAGFDTTCAERYRAAKTRFKKAWYTTPLEQGLSTDELRMQPPPNMPLPLWNDYVNFFSGERRQHIAQVNAANRQQQQYIARQGRTSQVKRRDIYREATGHYPPLIDQWADLHATRNGFYISDLCRQQHEEMATLWEQSETGQIQPMSENDIMDYVLHTRPGHRKGRGRIVSGVSYDDPHIAPQASPQFGQDSPDLTFSDWSEGPGQGSGAQDSD